MGSLSHNQPGASGIMLILARVDISTGSHCITLYGLGSRVPMKGSDLSTQTWRSQKDCCRKQNNLAQKELVSFPANQNSDPDLYPPQSQRILNTQLQAISQQTQKRGFLHSPPSVSALSQRSRACKTLHLRSGTLQLPALA